MRIYVDRVCLVREGEGPLCFELCNTSNRYCVACSCTTCNCTRKRAVKLVCAYLFCLDYCYSVMPLLNNTPQKHRIIIAMR